MGERTAPEAGVAIAVAYGSAGHVLLRVPGATKGNGRQHSRSLWPAAGPRRM